ncbi:MAG: hypothetical protein CL539_16920 [Alcanivorax sp.]|jgi:hypothetical protein|uniref:hypothetical protein n=1 Tax=Alcanivorax TaxID=59753 RepID=UPI000C602F90|nr:MULTISPECIES: hypothetical protein [Alcanivorax]MAC16336.1 hypothetical protein [Alcanivorax sp.]MBG32210.1 hypothetical protein [Alcanivorax sp.]MDF1637466.1 hypothetical protein [Alcanivorax jadensis]|tara:strand:+ start:14254 stop:15390 length:1137 start_codon:yes stop_codon:yes gene_type:complete
MKTLLSRKTIPAITLIALVAGCATSVQQSPDYNANASPVTQADSFINASHEKYMKGVNKVGVLSCNVMFAMTTAASASTSGGFRSDASRATGTIRRSDVQISVTYSAKGLDETDFQRLADEACSESEKQLASAGFQVVPHSTIKASDHYQALHSGGRESPFEYKGDGGTRYLVLARNGETISDQRYIGTAGGLGQAFKAAAGNASEQHEGRLIKTLGMTGVNVNILVDFAELESDGNQNFAGLSNKNSAKVKSKVQLAASGDIRFKPIEQQKCWKRFGKEECMIKPNHQPIFTSKQPVATSVLFYSSIEDVTTTGDKVTSGLTKTLGMLSALGGTSSNVAKDITRYQVNLIPGTYNAETKKLAGGLVGMAAAKASASR